MILNNQFNPLFLMMHWGITQWITDGHHHLDTMIITMMIRREYWFTVST